MIRALVSLNGKRSCNHMVFPSVHVDQRPPLSPCTAIILIRFSYETSVSMPRDNSLHAGSAMLRDPCGISNSGNDKKAVSTKIHARGSHDEIGLNGRLGVRRCAVFKCSLKGSQLKCKPNLSGLARLQSWTRYAKSKIHPMQVPRWRQRRGSSFLSFHYIWPPSHRTFAIAFKPYSCSTFFSFLGEVQTFPWSPSLVA